jgi:hypothetical protein
MKIDILNHIIPAKYEEALFKKMQPDVEGMDIPDSEKKKVFEDNARELMRLPA